MIYTRVVIDMASGETLEAQGYEYDGPLSLCGSGGGGSSTTNTVDYSYNWRMATLSEEQQDWAREYFGVWQEYQKPYEIAQAKANLEMLPYETSLYKQQLTGAGQLLGLETANALANMPKENELYMQGLAATGELLPLQVNASKQFLQAATQGVDVNERMALATADVSNAWKDAQAAANRANARLGVNPNSGRFQGIMAAQNTQQAAQMAGARTQARVGAEQENYGRLKDAANFNAAGSILDASQAIRPKAGQNSNALLQGIGYLKG